MVGQYRGQLWWDSIGAAIVGQYRGQLWWDSIGGSYGGTV